MITNSIQKMKRRHKMDKNLNSSYPTYKGTTEEPVDIKEYLNINYKYFKFLIKKASEGKEVTLPSRMGTIKIEGRVPVLKKEKDENGKTVIKGLPPDWVKTKALWERDPEAKRMRKRVFHLNRHTDGVVYKWKWSKKNVLVENKILYSLRQTRANKRLVNRLINEGASYPVKR